MVHILQASEVKVAGLAASASLRSGGWAHQQLRGPAPLPPPRCFRRLSILWQDIAPDFKRFGYYFRDNAVGAHIIPAAAPPKLQAIPLSEGRRARAVLVLTLQALTSTESVRLMGLW